MISFPGSPRLLKGAIVALNPLTKAPVGVIPFQYNPETLTRSLQIQTLEGEQNNRVEALRLKGAPVETFQIEIQLDATDRLEKADPSAIGVGLHPQLAALELLVYPNTVEVGINMISAALGVLEIIPSEAPMTLLVWGAKRVLPVRLTSFSTAEEAYDINLNPIRAKVTLGLRVLTYDDLPWSSFGSKLFFVHQVQKEILARAGTATSGVNLFL
ncbi:CIS tube protein [Leptolyngbya ohadii]|uniref:CIS tube protein n=1 Tax=Leptolyngbya ohadii TaxID=1962290 RepID=UPI000B59BEF7|nr:hypothetical protein [Leptolyngbya ohadii]